MQLRRGYTLVEIIIVMGIVAIVTTVLISSLFELGEQSDVEGALLTAESIFQEARRQTLASRNRQQFGVHIDDASNTITLFTGASFDPAAPDNEETTLPETVVITEVTLAGGGSDVVFDRLEGTTQHDGLVRLQSRRDASLEQMLVILPSGQVSRASQPLVADVRSIDTRHVHYDLGWSIQGSSSIILTFEDPPNSNVVESIDMSCCFTAGQTEFDWEDDVDVNGSLQHMRIHTHVLDATDTVLSVHRDRRENNRAVTIAIDGNDIVHYDVDGVITVLAFGGTEEVQ